MTSDPVQLARLPPLLRGALAIDDDDDNHDDHGCGIRKILNQNLGFRSLF